MGVADVGEEGGGAVRYLPFGSIVEFPDGQLGTVVYNGLDGRGIKWGAHDPDREEVQRYSQHPLTGEGEDPPADFRWEVEALLREPYPESRMSCAGEDYRVVRFGLHEDEEDDA